MSDDAPYDIDGAGDIYTGDQWPFLPKSWTQPKPLKAAAAGALGAAVVICALIIISWATGWMADEVSRVLP